jgi:predicted nuclease of predicted toxin-antitoxin system
VIRFAADENFNHTITRGLIRQRPDLDIVRVQDVGLAGAEDEAALKWAASEGRVLLTQDAKTVTKLAFGRVRAAKPMPGVIEIRRKVAIAVAIEELLIVAECSQLGEWEGQALYVPLR